LKTKLFMTTPPVLLVAGLVGGGATMAWFTDTATNAANTFTAGTVEIDVDRAGGDTTPGPMFYTTIAEGAAAPGQAPLHPTGVWWPGRTVSRELAVLNTGSLQVRLDQVSAEITSINGVSPGVNPALATSFADNMNVKIYVAGHPDDVLYNGPLATLLFGPQSCLHQPLIAPWTGRWPSMLGLVYEVTMLTSAGNDLQGIVPVVSFSVYAEQTVNNP